MPVTLVVAAVLGAVEGVVEAVYVASRDDLVPAMRGFLCALLVLKLAIARSAIRLSPAAAGLLMMYEATSLVAALASGFPALARLALAGTALGVLVLMGASLHAFPPPELRRSD